MAGRVFMEGLLPGPIGALVHSSPGLALPTAQCRVRRPQGLPKCVTQSLAGKPLGLDDGVSISSSLIGQMHGLQMDRNG